MTYVMSDLHGCYDLYRRMLQKINFSDDDTLYITGDSIDRGEDGIKLLMDFMERENVKLLMGNHEYMMAVLLSKIKAPVSSSTVLDDNAREGLQLWFDDGGRPTFLHFLSLPEDTQKRIVRFLVKLPMTAEITVRTKSFVLVHSGFENFDPSRALSSYTANELLFKRNHFETACFPNKTVVAGHTPTFDYGKEYTGKILHRNQFINVDCGCVYPESGVLGCLRLEDMTEFYTM